jgi:thioredoxin-related protein
MSRRKILPLILLVFPFLLPLAAAGQETMGQVRELVVREKKPALVYFFTPSCGYCQAMDRGVLADSDIRRELTSGVVFVRINGETAARAARESKIIGYPTTVLLDDRGKKIIQIPGYIGKKDFKTILSYLSGRHYKKMSLMEYLQKKG